MAILSRLDLRWGVGIPLLTPCSCQIGWYSQIMGSRWVCAYRLGGVLCVLRVEYFQARTAGFLGRLRGEQAELGRANCRLGAVGDPEFADYALHVGLHGQRTNDEALRDLLIGQPLGQQPQHFELPFRQRVREPVGRSVRLRG